VDLRPPASASELLERAKRLKAHERTPEAKEIAKGLREAEATVNPVVAARNQQTMLNDVVVVYFRVLRDERSRSSALLTPAVEGLSRVAGYINMAVIVDVLAMLRRMLDQDQEELVAAQLRLEDGRLDDGTRMDDGAAARAGLQLPLIAALRCVHTALELIEGAGRELAIDANVWVDHLYDLIGRMGASAAEVGPKELRVLLSAMRTAFIKRKEFGTERVAAFAKRLSVLALQLAPHVALGAIAFTRALMQVGGVRVIGVMGVMGGAEKTGR
jgi:nucleolar complex protein 3